MIVQGEMKQDLQGIFHARILGFVQDERLDLHCLQDYLQVYDLARLALFSTTYMLIMYMLKPEFD